MSAALGTTVVCLALRFAWEGQELRAGRRPVTGVEVLSVCPSSTAAAAARGRDAILYPLSPAPLRHLAGLQPPGQSLAVVLEPPLPPGPGRLEVRLSLEACVDPSLAEAPWACPGTAPSHRGRSTSLGRAAAPAPLVGAWGPPC
jgi:hypothetical protein